MQPEKDCPARNQAAVSSGTQFLTFTITRAATNRVFYQMSVCVCVCV
uniref:Uncharacterized protein n=1 Tax=Anguilla anguilla TaxID=7936 RepID=A0A0E9Q188_ANGAN